MHSRLITSGWWERQCPLYFPGFDARNRSVAATNAFTRGWANANATRLLHIWGTRDGWREAGVLSAFRPGGPLPSTERQPIIDIPGGFHTSDLMLRNGLVNADVARAQRQAIEIMKRWVAEFYASKGNS